MYTVTREFSSPVCFVRVIQSHRALIFHNSKGLSNFAIIGICTDIFLNTTVRNRGYYPYLILLKNVNVDSF